MDSANETALALIPASFVPGISCSELVLDNIYRDQPVMKHYSFIMGHALTFCYESSVLTHFLISINRFCAAWIPMRYDKWFSIKKTKKMIAALWILETMIAILFYQILCHVFYLEELHFIQFTNTEFCGLVAWYEDFVKNAIFIAIVVCIDVSTVLRVHHITKKVRALDGQNASKFSPRDIRFLKQTVCQGSVFLLELLTYFFVPQYVQNKWIVFFATSFAWVAIHAVDGLIVIICNPEVRKFLLGKKEVQHQPTTETGIITS
ncbi:unnamed protein product [Caenorhabditis brenneri]